LSYICLDVDIVFPQVLYKVKHHRLLTIQNKGLIPEQGQLTLKEATVKETIPGMIEVMPAMKT
jgi:hypothetical protein